MGKKRKIQFDKPDPAWTPFRKGGFTAQQTSEMMDAGIMPDEVYINSRYQVNLHYIQAGHSLYPVEITEEHLDYLIYLSIKRLDKKPIRNWRDLQRVKNEVVGPEFEAMELYPAESRLVDVANQTHLWVLPSGKSFPWGWFTRAVTGEETVDGSKQEPLEDPPEDALSAEEVKEKMEELLGE